MNTIIEWIKLIAECITAVSAAVIVLQKAIDVLPNWIIRFFEKIKDFLHLFFLGFTEIDGKKIRGFKAIKANKERIKTIINAVAPNLKTEEVLILNQAELQKILTDSKIFTKETVRTK